MGVRRALGSVRRVLTACLLFLVTRAIVSFLPKDRWYEASLRSAKLLTQLFHSFTPNTKASPSASTMPRLLHRHLDFLATQAEYFPIPTVVEGEEHLIRYAAEPGGFVACSAHLPFVKLGFPLLHSVVAPPREIRIVSKDPSGHVSGWNDVGLDIIRADNSVLLHTRSFLRQSGVLLLAVDRGQGDVISANIFRFAGKLQSRVLLFFPRLLEDGSILLKWMVPPHPHCRTEEEIQENLDVVSENISRILRGDGIRETHEVVPGGSDEQPADLARELHRIRLYSDTQLEARIRRIQSFLNQKEGDAEESSALGKRLAALHAERQARERAQQES